MGVAHIRLRCAAGRCRVMINSLEVRGARP
jgi:hypothetical protein